MVDRVRMAGVGASLFLGFAACAGVARAEQVCNTGVGLNVRAEPSISAPVGTTLADGTEFLARGTSEDGLWTATDLGWVYTDYVCPSGTVPSNNRSGSASGNGGGGGTSSWRNPVAGSCVTDPYGWRTEEVAGASPFHYGCDLGAACGANIQGIAPGVVIAAGWNGNYGYQVSVQHPDGTVSSYAHMSQILVEPGQSVGANTVLGLVGTTGLSTGCHVHLETRRNGETFDPQSLIGYGGCPTSGASTGAEFLRP